jgi:hypothetical protein
MVSREFRIFTLTTFALLSAGLPSPLKGKDLRKKFSLSPSLRRRETDWWVLRWAGIRRNF